MANADAARAAFPAVPLDAVTFTRLLRCHDVRCGCLCDAAGDGGAGVGGAVGGGVVSCAVFGWLVGWLLSFSFFPFFLRVLSRCYFDDGFFSVECFVFGFGYVRVEN